MNLKSAQELILQAQSYFDHHSEGYQTWGKVELKQVAIRVDKNKILISHPTKSLSEQTIQDFELIPSKGKTYFQKIFFWKWNMEVAFITKQEYASQVNETIPPILDDQAQLLGVNIKITNKPEDIICTLFSRYATILQNGQSICIGKTFEDTFVAAQLLEKTSKAWVEGKYLGGAIPINIIEAWAMQQFYLLKYSKEAQKNK